jgi:UDP-N-acetylmuramoyl-tripeptide--D-alanyl-D-alanine ligase
MITLDQLAGIVGGQIEHADGSVVVSAPPVYDSREATAGSVFLALKGDAHDGHDHVESALEAGAVAALVTRSVGKASIVVDDVLNALSLWAAHHRASLPSLKTIGITGSQGKTTTKDLLAQILERVGETVSPIGSYNNDLGAPLTLLRCTEQTTYCIIEMGARHEGDIARLARIADLDVGVVLVVGSAHLGEFGSREAIARTKGEIVRDLRPDAVAVLGTYDEYTAEMATSADRVLRFGPTGEIRAEEIELHLARARFTLRTPEQSVWVSLQMPGEHQVANALAAATAALALGVGLNDIAEALSSATARSGMRMEMLTRGDGLVVINDAYNANPESVRAALRTLADFARERGGRGWAVLGEMRELGASSAQEHDSIGRLAVRLDISRLIAVGPGAKAIHMGAAHEGSWGEESVYVESMDQAIALLRDQVEPQDVVLVKASRSIGLEGVALALMEDQL